MEEIDANDGLLRFPYTDHDKMILFVFVFGYLTRMYLMHKSKDIRKPTITDWLGMLVISAFFVVPTYEVSIKKKWEILKLYVIIAVEILISKDVLDWLLLSKDGRFFVINTFKELASALLGRFGFVQKKDEESE